MLVFGDKVRCILKAVHYGSEHKRAISEHYENFRSPSVSLTTDSVNLLEWVIQRVQLLSVPLSQSKELWVVPVAAVEVELQADVRITVLVVLADVTN